MLLKHTIGPCSGGALHSLTKASSVSTGMMAGGGGGAPSAALPPSTDLRLGEST